MRLHGAIDITQIKHTWKGRWNEQTIYALNDVIIYNGEKFVCITTDLLDQRKYGRRYMPTVANEYWQPFSYGYVWRGGWTNYDYYYPGDVIKWNSDWYVCKEYNYNAHPVYEFSGRSLGLTTKWQRIMKSTSHTKGRNVISYANENPFGWNERNMGYNGYEMSYTAYSHHIPYINGDFQGAFTGGALSYYGNGLGDTTSAYFAGMASPAYEFMDYLNGNRPASVTGEAPKAIQYLQYAYHGMTLFDNGELYITGYGGNGQQGLGDATTRYAYSRAGHVLPNQSGYNGANDAAFRYSGVLKDAFIIKASSNAQVGESTYIHCLALDSDGNVWGWGYNGYGQANPNGDDHNTYYPIKIPAKYFDYAKIVDIWAHGTGSYGTSYALDENGDLWAWGYAGFGNLGTGNYSSAYQTSPAKVAIDFAKYGGLKKLQLTGHSNSAQHGAFALTGDGQVWVWGGSYDYAGSIKGIGWESTYLHRPQPFAQFMWETLSNEADLTKTEIKKIGDTLDTYNNVENFWVSQYSSNQTTFIKEKVTGSIYVAGYQSSYSHGNMYQDHGFANADLESAFSNVHKSWFNRSYTGNLQDVVDIKLTGDTSLDFALLNSDGRVWVMGNNEADAIRGCGVTYLNAKLAEFRRLPWEMDLDDVTTPTQVRDIHNASAMYPAGNGFMSVITRDNLLKFWGTHSTSYPIASPKSSGATVISNPVRNPYVN